VLLFLTKPLQYLPNAVLAAVVFLIGLKLIDIRGPARDSAPAQATSSQSQWLTAAVVVVVGVEQGIILAIVLSLILHVRRHYAPVDVVLTWDEHHHVRSLQPGPGVRSEPGIVVYRFGAGIFYANAQRLSDEVLELAGGDRPPKWIVIAAGSVDDIDFSGGKTLGELAGELQQRGIVLAMTDVRNSVRTELDRYGLTALIGVDKIFDSVESALDAFHAERRD
jgi:SulP family sulfate permease